MQRYKIQRALSDTFFNLDQRQNYLEKLYRPLKYSLKKLLGYRCLECQSVINNQQYPLCEPCYLALPFQQHACQQCGQPLTHNQDYCGRCLTKPPYYDTCFSPFEYEQPIKSHIHAFKYQQRPELALALAQVFAREIQDNGIPRPDYLIPVPIHISKLRHRGYNQANLLAKQLSHLLTIAVANTIIEKHKPTQAQAALSMAQRQNNVRNCFKLINKIPGKHVAIVDDVITTGATANEIAKILKQNGVDYCQVWGITRSV